MASGSDQEEVHYDIHKMTALKKHLSRKEGNKGRNHLKKKIVKFHNFGPGLFRECKKIVKMSKFWGH